MQDTEAPILGKFNIVDDNLRPGDTLQIAYEYTDETGLFGSINRPGNNTSIFHFKHAEGNAYAVTDRDFDGIAEIEITDGKAAGEYTLSFIQLKDDSDLINTVRYNADGSVTGDVDFTTHDFDFSKILFTVDPDRGQTMEQIIIGDPFEPYFGSDDDEYFKLQAISSSWPPGNVILSGGGGYDILDASDVMAGSSKMFISDISYSPSRSLQLGDFALDGFEEIYGNATNANHFLTQKIEHEIVLHGGSGDDWFVSSFGDVGSRTADTFYGYEGDDYFQIRIVDKAYGGMGNDTFELYATNEDVGSSIIEGGMGSDTLRVGFGWNVNLKNNTADSPFVSNVDTYSFSSIENVSVYAWRNYETVVAGSSDDNEFSVDPAFNDGTVGVTFSGFGGNDKLLGSTGNDILDGGEGHDYVMADAGNDTIHYQTGADYIETGDGIDVVKISSEVTWNKGYAALNLGGINQVGTNEIISLDGKFRLEMVIHGQVNYNVWQDYETINEIILSSDFETPNNNKGYALFLHDAYSAFHDHLGLDEDFNAQASTARLFGISDISGSTGDDIIDLTSPDYSLAAHTILIGGGEGDDVIWGSDASENIEGNSGDDVLFGGAGANVLTGGLGADEFQFTSTSTDDTITDFNITDGDTLKFFNTGGAEFDISSMILNGEVLSIHYSNSDSLSVLLEGTNLAIEDLYASILVV